MDEYEQDDRDAAEAHQMELDQQSLNDWQRLSADSSEFLQSTNQE